MPFRKEGKKKHALKKIKKEKKMGTKFILLI